MIMVLRLTAALGCLIAAAGVADAAIQVRTEPDKKNVVTGEQVVVSWVAYGSAGEMAAIDQFDLPAIANAWVEEVDNCAFESRRTTPTAYRVGLARVALFPIRPGTLIVPGIRVVTRSGTVLESAPSTIAVKAASNAHGADATGHFELSCRVLQMQPRIIIEAVLQGEGNVRAAKPPHSLPLSSLVLLDSNVDTAHDSNSVRFRRVWRFFSEDVPRELAIEVFDPVSDVTGPVRCTPRGF